MIDRETGRFYVVRPGSGHAEPDGYITDFAALIARKR